MHGMLDVFGAAFGDDPAIALYTKPGSREDVLHFNIDTQARPARC